jgi:hypothetical protein
VTSDRNSQSMEFIEPNFLYSTGLSVGQDDGSANKLGSSFIEFGEDGARSRFGSWHDVARIGCKVTGVAYESVKLVANARRWDGPWNLRPRLRYRSPEPIVEKHAGIGARLPRLTTRNSAMIAAWLW